MIFKNHVKPQECLLVSNVRKRKEVEEEEGMKEKRIVYIYICNYIIFRGLCSKLLSIWMS